MLSLFPLADAAHVLIQKEYEIGILKMREGDRITH
jgi:hypothetical protein